MKSIDIKSIIIGALLTSTIFLGVAATSKDDAGKWDDNQEWEIATAKGLEVIEVTEGKKYGSICKTAFGDNIRGINTISHVTITGWEPYGQGVFRRRTK